MLFTNTQTSDVQHVAPTPPCCARAVVLALLSAGYHASDWNARAYVRRIYAQSHASNANDAVRQ